MPLAEWEVNYVRAILAGYTEAGYTEADIAAVILRQKLEQDLARLKSEVTIMAAAEDAQNQAYVQAWAAKQAAIAAKQAEIDALAAG